MNGEALSKLALSKIQRLSGQIPTDLISRVTAIEMITQDVNTRLDVMEQYAISGYSGTISVVESVNFTAQTIVTKIYTFENGKLIGV